MTEYTKVPNALIRSLNLDPIDKVVFCCIASCGLTAFPGYKILMEWAGCSRGRLWQALRKLEKRNVIRRFKRGRQIVYQTHWNPEPEGLEPVHFMNSTSSQDELDQFTTRTSPVHQVNPIKNNYKDSIKRTNKKGEFKNSPEEKTKDAGEVRKLALVMPSMPGGA
jgi:hypothetical protein